MYVNKTLNYYKCQRKVQQNLLAGGALETILIMAAKNIDFSLGHKPTTSRSSSLYKVSLLTYAVNNNPDIRNYVICNADDSACMHACMHPSPSLSWLLCMISYHPIHHTQPHVSWNLSVLEVFFELQSQWQAISDTSITAKIARTNHL